jgi:hypothetical protein
MQNLYDSTSGHEKEFSEYHSGGGSHDYMWGEQPFVVSVLCDRTERGFITSWWVSGKKGIEDAPTLVLQARMSVPAATQDELLAALHEYWNDCLRELAFGSAVAGGVKVTPAGLKELEDARRGRLLDFHLKGNDLFRNFYVEGTSKVERTGRMYAMLKAMGSLQPQRTIANFETGQLGTEVKATAINQRLVLAKRQGLVSVDMPVRQSGAIANRK